jgi:chromosome segregation ATPase
MPGNWTSIETHFPTFTGKETVATQISMLQEYMYILTEQLKYNLSNLDMKNWNSKALQELSQKIGQDALGDLSGIAEELKKLAASVSGTSSRLTAVAETVGQHGSRLDEDEEQIRRLQEEDARMRQDLDQMGEALADQGQQFDQEIQQMQENASRIGERMEQAESALEGIGMDLEDLFGRVVDQGDLADRLETVEGKVRRIEFAPDGTIPNLDEGDILLVPENVEIEEDAT